MDIMVALKPLGELSKEGKYQEGLDELGKLWATIPDPKHSVNNSYLIVAYGVRISQKLNDLDRAWEWAQRARAFSGTFNLGGESEFLIGEVAYSRADLETARQYFQRAKKMSGKRLFKDKNPQYLELIAK